MVPAGVPAISILGVVVESVVEFFKDRNEVKIEAVLPRADGLCISHAVHICINISE